MTTITQKEEEKDLSASAQLGVDLGVLIAGLRVNDEVKESLLTVMEQATPQQLLGLREALVHELLMESTKEVDESYEQRLRSLVKEFEKKKDELELEADNELVMIRQELASKQSASRPGAIII